MNIAKLLVSTVAMGAGLIGLTSEAHASFSVVIDCHGDNGLPSWAATTNTIKIEALVNGVYNVLWNRPVPATLCDGEDEVVARSAAFAASNVQEIRVTTNGSNSFWIDVLYLKDALGNTYRHWGGDNNFGYCVSTDGDDGEYSYCYEGEAKDEWTFTP